MKVILIGKGKGWWNAPEFGNIWGIHSLCLRREGLSMVWDMHKIDEDNNGCEPAQQEMIIDYINEEKIPYMTLRRHDDIPTSIAFPIWEMPLQYAECSMSYMIWYAYYIGATEIEMYGICLGIDSEYYVQRPSVEYWIGYVRGKGVKVTINEPTEICKSRKGLYGYDYVSSESDYQREMINANIYT